MNDRGDEAQLFAELHDHLVAQLTSALRGDRHLAEEAAGMAWLIFLRRQPPRGPNLPGWLFVTARHEAWRMARRRLRDEHLFAAPDVAAVTGAGRDPLVVLEERDQLELVGELSAPQRLTLTLFARGYSYREIEAMTGRTYTWVNRHITEGRARLRQLLAEAA